MQIPIKKYFNAHTIKKDLRIITAKRKVWILLIYIGLLSAPMTAFAALWGIPFLTQGWHWSRDMAASAMSLTWVGGLLGGPLLGYCADIFSIHKSMLVIIGIIVSIIMSIILFVHASILTTTALLIVLGALCNGNVIVFAIMSDLVSKKSVDFMNGFTNMFNMGGGPLFQILIGGILGAPTYNLIAYQKALSITPGLLLLFSLLLGISYIRNTTTRADLSY